MLTACGQKPITMTYQEFKLCIIQQAAGTAHYPNVLKSLQQTIAEADSDAIHNATADEILSIAYADYCLTHGIIE